MDHVERSPYLRALGEQRRRLHPRLEAYFTAVPDGRVGIASGTFERAGTPRRWLWPLYRRWFHDAGAVFAGWAEQVPFTVRNRTVAGRAIGERELQLPDGSWTMRDSVIALPHGRIVDRLGEPIVLSAVFDVEVDDAGALALRSRSVGIRVRGQRVRLPRPIAPVIRLRESFDERTEVQRVEVTVDAPLIGRIYEYAGTFTYAVEEERA